jgi:hypothetical protein
MVHDAARESRKTLKYRKRGLAMMIKYSVENPKFF